MNCPYCNGEMEKGYMEQTRIGYPLQWIPNYEKRGLIMYDISRRIELSSTRKTGRVIVHYCSQCRKFVIDQDELQV